MEKNSDLKRQKCCDLIDNLPEPIISYILSFLPTQSAFATSFLSKTWKLRWTKITTLDFDDDLWSDCKMSFVEFVNMVLIYHTAEIIENFHLRCGSCDVPSVYLNIWVNSAISRDVKVLELALSEMNQKEVMLPGAMYTCGTLEVLKLEGLILVKPPSIVCLPKLSEIELIEVRYESDESFFKLISGCPVLESLSIKRLYMDDNLFVCKVSSPVMKRLRIYTDDVLICPHQIIDPFSLEINAPALEFLDLQDVLSVTISIHDVASVNEVELDLSCCTHEEDKSRADMIVGVVQAFHRAKSLNLSEGTVIGLGRATKKVSTSFERLTELVLTLDSSLWSSALDLIDRCIKLEVLDMNCLDEFDDSDDEQYTYWRQPTKVPSCLSSSLRQVSFTEFDGRKDEIGMLKFILNHGLLMERVYICSHKVLRNRSKITKLTKLPRASPACEILFS